MEFKLSLKWSWFILAVAGILLVFFLQTFNLYVEHSSSQPVFPAEQTGAGIPVRFKIPKINVDTAVEQVGLNSDGAMDVPKKPDDVAWFNLGPRPGDVGSSVIAGHSGWKNGRPAIFDSLSKLQKGDKIYTEDKKGIITTFVVRETRIYGNNADAESVFDSSDNLPHLNLITCEGVWNEIEQTHSNRLVVFADKEIGQ